MIYQITIPKIHCLGCVNLISISLKEIFGNVKVDLASKIAEFTSDKEIEDVKFSLDEIFVELIEIGYQYINLNKKD